MKISSSIKITTLTSLILVAIFMSLLVVSPALAEDTVINKAKIQFIGERTDEGLRLIKLFSASDPATVWLLIGDDQYKVLNRCKANDKLVTVGYDDKTRKVSYVTC